MEFKEIDLKDYVKVLYKNRFIFVWVFAAVLLFTIIITALTPKVYEARSTIIFSGGSSALEQYVSFGGISLPTFGSKEGSSVSASAPSVLNPLMGKISSASYTKVILQSKSMKLALAKKLNLYDVYHVKNDEIMIGIVGANSAVFTDKDGLLTVQTKAHTRELAAAMANGYVDLMKEYNDKNKVGLARKRRIFVEKQLVEKRKELAELNKKMEENIAKYQIFDIGTFTTGIQDEKKWIENSLRESEVEILKLKSSLMNLKNELIAQMKASEEDFTRFNSVTDQELNKIREDLVNKKINLIAAQKGRSKDHPVVSKLNLEIKTLENIYRQQIAKYLVNLNSNYSKEFITLQTNLFLMEANKKALEVAQKKFEEKMTKLPKIVLDYMDLKREFDTKKSTCIMLERDLESTRIAEAQEIPELEVLDAAFPPRLPIYPKVKFNLFVGFFFAVVFGLIAAISWEYLDNNLVQDIVRKAKLKFKR